MQDAVLRLLELGQLPPEDGAEEATFERYHAALSDLRLPATDEEAGACLSVLPAEEGSMFGLAWSLVHFVETAPSWPVSQLGGFG